MTFLLELWQDLREKRLWPVAVGLLAAIVAIPVVLLKPAAAPVPAPRVATNQPDANALPAVEVDTSPTHGSKLETFRTRNPFKSLADLKKDDAGTPSSSTSSPTGSGGKSSGGASAAGSPGSAGGSGGSAGGATSGGGSGGGSTPSGGSTGGPRVQWFRYTADIRFGEPGHQKKMESVPAMTLLPDETTGAIVFMGVSDDAKRALFFIADPALVPDGEGKCNSEDACRFVALGVGEGSNEESFTSADGSTQYDLKLVKLNRENVSASDAAGDTTPKAKRSSGAGGMDVKEAGDSFLPRLLDAPLASETK